MMHINGKMGESQREDRCIYTTYIHILLKVQQFDSTLYINLGTLAPEGLTVDELYRSII